MLFLLLLFFVFNSVEFLELVGVQRELREPYTLPEPESCALCRWCLSLVKRGSISTLFSLQFLMLHD